jgi:hypothetical protein
VGKAVLVRSIPMAAWVAYKTKNGGPHWMQVPSIALPKTKSS